MAGNRFADYDGVAPQWVTVHRFEDTLRFICGDDGNELPLVCNVQRVEPENFARTFHLLLDRNFLFDDFQADLCALGKLLERACNSATRWISQRANIRAGGEHRFDERMQWSRIALKLRFKLQPLSYRHDRDAVLGNLPTDDDGVAGANVLRIDINTRHDKPDARGVDEYLVRFSSVNHLGITGDEENAGTFGSAPHRDDNLPQLVHRKAFFNNEGSGKKLGHCAAHGKVVDSPIYRKLTDISSWEKNRIDDI